MNGPWMGPDHLMRFEMGGPRITTRVMWPSRSGILVTTEHQIMFKVLLQQLLPTMAAMDHTQPMIPIEETGENKIEAVLSMAAKVLSPQKRYFDTLHVTVARLVYLTWVR